MMAVPAGNLTTMVGDYVSEKLGMRFVPGTYQAMMVINDEKDFVAGVVFTNYRQLDVEISCVSETPAAWRPHVCRAVFKYVFDQLGCVRCTSITSKGNKRARTFLEGLGFVLEGNIRLGYDGHRDALVYGLLKAECRFLADDCGVDDGEERTEPATGTGPGSDSPSANADERRVGDGASEPEPDRPVHAAGV